MADCLRFILVSVKPQLRYLNSLDLSLFNHEISALTVPVFFFSNCCFEERYLEQIKYLKSINYYFKIIV